MNLRLRHVLVAGVILLPGCSGPSRAEPAPTRRSPVAVPAAPPSASSSAEEPAPTEVIDPEAGEQLAMAATATMTVTSGGVTSTDTLVQSDQAESVLEQSAGETSRVLRLNTAATKKPDDVQFSIDGIASPGTYRTGVQDLRVVFFNTERGVDLLSDQGECSVVFNRVDPAGATGLVSCADIVTPDGKAQLSATFVTVATDKP